MLDERDLRTGLREEGGEVGEVEIMVEGNGGAGWGGGGAKGDFGDDE